jgi:hypothetical protein
MQYIKKARVVVSQFTENDFVFATPEIVQKLIDESPSGKNSRFLLAAHNLWIRFEYYKSSPPLYLRENDKIVALIFATYPSAGHTNLYEIVTVQGEEGKGYASKIWDRYVHYAFHKMKCSRLKMSCTPSSVTWHMRNGLVFWSIDPSGSLRSDQPLYPTREEQIEFREKALLDPKIAFPDDSTIAMYKIESIEYHETPKPKKKAKKFNEKKKQEIDQAIKDVGKYWLREALFDDIEKYFA